MKRLLKYILPVIILMALGGAAWMYSSPDTAVLEKPMMKPKIGDDEDPQARFDYEFMKIRNPITGEVPKNIRQDELAFAKTLPVHDEFARISLGKGASSVGFGTWTNRGPYNVGGRTRALAIDVSNESNILAGGVSGGMYRSTDGGATWTKTTTAAQLHSVTAIVQDKRSGKTSTWYYSTGEKEGNSADGGGSASYLGDGIYKSTDGGATWTVLPNTTTGTPQSHDQAFDKVFNLALDQSNTTQDEIYAATGWRGGILRSMDGGTTWTNEIETYAYYSDVAATTTGVIYATSSSDGNIKGIWRSTDGDNWTDITPGSFPSTYGRIVLGIAPSNENIVYFLAYTSGAGLNNHSLWKYTYVSGDGTGAGGTWEDRSANMPDGSTSHGKYDSQTNYNMIVAVKPDNADVVFIGGTSLFRSTDGFATASNTHRIGGYALDNNNTSFTNHHPDVHSNAFLPSNSSVMFSGHDGGLSKTTNCLADSSSLAWSSLNIGYLTTQFYTVAIDHGTANDQFIVGGMQDNGTYKVVSDSTNTSWSTINSGDGAFCAVVDGRGTAYTSSQNGNVYRSTLDSNGDETAWTRVDPDGASGGLFINPFILDKNNQNIMYYPAGEYIWRNSDLSGIENYSSDKATTNWAKLDGSQISGSTITALDVSKTPANILYYGTSDGKVYKITDASTGSPTGTSVFTESSGAYVSCIAVDPYDGNNVLVVFSNYGVKSIYNTTDGGSNWTSVSGNLEQRSDGSGTGPSVRWASILKVGSNKVYFAATSTGLYSTLTLNADTTSWSQEGVSTIGNVVVDMIDVRESDGLVVAATHGGGVYWANITEGSLPVEMASFSCTPGEKGITINWVTESEVNNYGFEVERSFDGISYAKIDFIHGYGTTNELRQYAFTDPDMTPGARYYRLKQIDLSGHFKYTDVINMEVAAPVTYSLAQNYPNPFNPDTNIKYSLVEAGDVSLEIYNIRGQLIRTLVSTRQEAGSHTTQWNGRNDAGRMVSSGTYFYRIHAGDFTAIKKMMLIK